MIPFFEALFDRFHELHTEIEKALDLLPAEALDWKPGPEMNSVSVLVVHLTGGERFWIGDIVMDDSSNRNRGAEFHVAGLGIDVLIKHLTETEAYIKAAFDTLILKDLETRRPTPPYGREVTVAWACLHALEHTALHLGHIQLTVQLWHQKSVGEG
jgi:uncharacterized damage-inducible protein DinB